MSFDQLWVKIDRSPRPDSVDHECVKMNLTKPLSNWQKRRLKAQNCSGILHRHGKSICRYKYFSKNTSKYFKSFKTGLVFFCILLIFTNIIVYAKFSKWTLSLHFFSRHKNCYLFHFMIITENTFVIYRKRCWKLSLAGVRYARYAAASIFSF